MIARPALSLLLAAVALAGCGRGDPPKPAANAAAPALTVTLASAERKDLSRTLVANGSVVAWQELVLGSEAQGMVVAEVLVDEGDLVKAGQLLARLDDSVLSAQLRQQESAIIEAQAALVEAKSNFSRAGALRKQGTVSEQTAEAREAEARQAAARVAAAEARRDELRARIAQTRIEAPTDGTITRRSVAVGSVPGSGTELFRMVRDNRIELDAQLAEVDLPAVQPGQKVLVTHESGVSVTGEVRAVAPTLDARTRQGIVHVALPAGTGLKPGMFARAQIEVQRAPAVIVPEQAVVSREGKPQVFALGEDARVVQRAIETGVRRDGYVEVRQGLQAGDRIVLAGAGYLRDGDVVRVQGGAAAAPAAAKE
jgi:RND family efflux transporter MFP subunit